MRVESTELRGNSELVQLKIDRQSFDGFDLIKYVPEHPTSVIPVLIAPGYRSGAYSYELLIKTLNYQFIYTSISLLNVILFIYLLKRFIQKKLSPKLRKNVKVDIGC